MPAYLQKKILVYVMNARNSLKLVGFAGRNIKNVNVQKFAASKRLSEIS